MQRPARPIARSSVCVFEDSSFANVVNQMTSLCHLSLEYLLGIKVR